MTMKFICWLFILVCLLVSAFIPICTASYQNLQDNRCCEGLGENERLNEACNYWGRTGVCPSPYIKDPGVKSQTKCPCTKDFSINTYNTQVNTISAFTLQSTPAPTFQFSYNDKNNPELKIRTDSDSIQRGNSFYTIIDGPPGAEVYLWLQKTGSMASTDQVPYIIVDDLINVKTDKPQGPYQIGKYQFSRGGGESIKADVLDDRLNHGTTYYALVTLGSAGSKVIPWKSTENTKEGRYTIRVESSSGSGTVTDEVNIWIGKQASPSQVAPIQTTTLKPFLVSTPLPVQTIRIPTTPVPDYLPFYSSGSTVTITNNLGSAVTVVWTNTGSKKRIFSVHIPNEGSKTVSIPVGTFDEYVKADYWYRAGTSTFLPNYAYEIRYYITSGSGLGTGLARIHDSEAPTM